MTQPLILAYGYLLLLAPLGIVIYTTHWRTKQLRAERKDPFSQDLLRPPGESLRLKMDELMGQLLGRVLFLCGLLAFPGVVVLGLGERLSVASQPICFVLLPLLCFSVGVRQFHKTFSFAKQISNHRLGFEGERRVGMELTRLMLRQHHVFHDLIFRGKSGKLFNIDHLVVGESGVYVIETKARRKRVKISRSNVGPMQNYIVWYDGERLIFPGGYRDRKPVIQARSNAKDVAKWIFTEVGAEVRVEPVIIVPGWSIEYRRPPKELLRVLPSGEITENLLVEKETRLDEVLVAKIVKLADDKCRTEIPDNDSTRTSLTERVIGCGESLLRPFRFQFIRRRLLGIKRLSR